jgi:hypothetical protein
MAIFVAQAAPTMRFFNAERYSPDIPRRCWMWNPIAHVMKIPRRLFFDTNLQFQRGAHPSCDYSKYYPPPMVRSASQVAIICQAHRYTASKWLLPQERKKHIPDRKKMKPDTCEQILLSGFLGGAGIWYPHHGSVLQIASFKRVRWNLNGLTYKPICPVIDSKILIFGCLHTYIYICGGFHKRENPIKMHDLGYPPISGNLHIYK